MRDEELREPHQARQKQTESRYHEMPQPSFCGMDPRDDSHAQSASGNLKTRVHRHQHVANPIDQAHERHPVHVGIIPGSLRGKRFHRSQQTRSHEAEKGSIHRGRIGFRTRKAQYGDGEEERRKGGQNHVSGPVRQVQDPVRKRHRSSYASIDRTNFQIPETHNMARATATKRMAGRFVAKLRMAPTIASPAAIGMIVPAK